MNQQSNQTDRKSNQHSQFSICAKSNPKIHEIKQRLHFNHAQLTNIIHQDKQLSQNNINNIVKSITYKESLIKTMKKLVKVQEQALNDQFNNVNSRIKRKENNQRLSSLGQLDDIQSISKNDNLKESQINNTGYNNYPMFIYEIQDQSSQYPETREGAKSVYLNNNLFLYGGVGVDIFNSFWKYSFISYKWVRITLKGDYPNIGRYSISMIEYKNQVFIFGGEGKFNKTFKIRECFNDVYSIDIENETLNQVKCSGDIIEPRRNHSVNIIGKFMFVLGGLNAFSRHLASVVCLNLETFQWNILQLTGFQPIAYHCSCAVFKGDVRLDHPYYPYMVKPFQKMGKLDLEEGIYVFGGEQVIQKENVIKSNDEDKLIENYLENNEILECINILTIGVKPLTYRKIETIGKKPTKRINSTMHYDAVTTYLYIIGGRTLNSSYETQLIKNIYCLNLKNKNWINIITIGCVFKNRYSHCSTQVENKIIIFGGRRKIICKYKFNIYYSRQQREECIYFNYWKINQQIFNDFELLKQEKELDLKNLKNILLQNKNEKLVVQLEFLILEKYIELIDKEKKLLIYKTNITQQELLCNSYYQINSKYSRQLKEKITLYDIKESKIHKINVMSYMPVPLIEKKEQKKGINLKK